MAPKNAAAQPNGGATAEQVVKPSDFFAETEPVVKAEQVAKPGSDEIRRLVGYDRVVELFDVAGAGADQGNWAQRFQAHAEMLEGQTSTLPKADILSLRFDLLKVVEERLNERCNSFDTKLADGLEEFHQEIKLLFNETLALARKGEDLAATQTSGKGDDVTSLLDPLSPGSTQPLSPTEANENDLTIRPTLQKSPSQAFDCPIKAANYHKSKRQCEAEQRKTIRCSKAAAGETTEDEILLSDDGEGSWYEGRMSVRDEIFSGVKSFVDRRKPASRPAAMRFSERDDEDEQSESWMKDITDSMRLKPKHQENTWIAEHTVDNGKRYNTIHKDCAKRVRSLQQEDDKEKVVSAGQLREIMYGCLKGKAEKDASCKENNSPCLTLEHFLYEFLELRYNCTEATQVKEWFSALNKSISKNGLFDCEFSVFGKMLKNALPESFPKQQKILHQTAEKHLKEIIGQQAFSVRNFNDVPLKDYETLVDKLFNKRDASDILKRVKDPLPRTGKRYAANMEALANGNVRWLYALEIILTFNMNIQDDFLAAFCKDFKVIDVAGDGTLPLSGLQALAEIYATVDNVPDGSLEYTMLVDAKATVLRSIRKARRMTFSEAAIHFIDLQNSRWTITRKKGVRYNYHDKLKGQLIEIEKEKERQIALAEAYKKKSERQKRIANFSKEEEAKKTDESDRESPKNVRMSDQPAPPMIKSMKASSSTKSSILGSSKSLTANRSSSRQMVKA